MEEGRSLRAEGKGLMEDFLPFFFVVSQLLCIFAYRNQLWT
jgi:hypothetical protein